jgi:hypothetical protein
VPETLDDRRGAGELHRAHGDRARRHEHSCRSTRWSSSRARRARRAAGEPRRDPQKIWGLEASSTNRTVDNFIVKLRKKIEKSPDKPQHILTVYGFGYKLVK